MTSHRRARFASFAAFAGCMACGGISSNSPDDMVGGTGSGATAAGGGYASSGGDGSGATGSGGGSVLPDDCPPFAEWDPALRAAVQEATASDVPSSQAWEALSFLGVKGGSSAVGVAGGAFTW